MRSHAVAPDPAEVERESGIGARTRRVVVAWVLSEVKFPAEVKVDRLTPRHKRMCFVNRAYEEEKAGEEADFIYQAHFSIVVS